MSPLDPADNEHQAVIHTGLADYSTTEEQLAYVAGFSQGTKYLFDFVNAKLDELLARS